MPQLWAVLFVVCTLSLYLDNRNLLRVLQPPPQSDVSQVGWTWVGRGLDVGWMWVGCWLDGGWTW
eukprot:4678528-Prymnesium_polylepis.1